MKWLMRFATRHPVLTLLLIAALTAVFVQPIGQLRYNISAKGMMVDHDPARTFYEAALETFGADNPTILVLSDENLFSVENLHAARAVVDAIEKLPFVDHTESLFSIAHVRTEDDFVYTDPYLKTIPETREAVDGIIAQALNNPLIAGNLVSADGTSMAVNIYTRRSEDDPDFDHRVTTQIDAAIEPLRERLTQVFQLGDPFVRTAISGRINDDQRIILPASLAVLLLTLGLTLRRLTASIIPMLTAGLSIAWTLGLMAWLDIPINVMTAIVPALLIIIGSTEDIHMLAEYQAGINSGLARRDAIGTMTDRMGFAVLLTFITTYLGFVSIWMNKLDLLKQFGLVASTGLLLNFLITILLVPVCLRYFGSSIRQEAGSAGPDVLQRLAERGYRLISGHKKAVATVLAAAVAVSIYGATFLRVDNDPMGLLGKDSEVVIRATALHENLSGVKTLSIVLTGTDGAFLRVPYLQEIQRLQQQLAKFGHFDKSLSFADFIATVHGGIDAERKGEAYLPESDDIVSEYMLFIDHEQVRSFVSKDYSQARIIVRHNLGSSHELKQAIAEVRDYVESEVDPDLNVTFTGGPYLSALGTDLMADSQARSIGLMMLVIFVIISFLFVNFRAGLIALTANLFPIAILFGFMGFAQIPLDTGTTMIGAIALGICVDHTMHFMVRYQSNTRLLQEEIAALSATVREEAMPIMTTAIALAAGFGVLAISSFPPVAWFGLLSAMVMLLALIATFAIMPMLLESTRLITVWDVLTVKLKSNILNNCQLFAGMRPSQIKRIILVSDVKDYAEGDDVVRQGEKGDELFVILEGAAEVWQTGGDGSRHRLRTLHAGDVFGEIALISDKPRTADVVATEPTSVLAFKWDGIHRIARIFPRISTHLFRNMSSILGERLAETQSSRETLHDDLTGAVNRRHFDGLLRFAIDRAQRYEEPLSLLVLGIDGFDILQKDHGHRVGDAVLKALATEISHQTRRVDVFARWSGEQFAILLPQTTVEKAGHVAARLQHIVSGGEFADLGKLHIRMSLTHWRSGEDLDELLSRAEESLIKAREAGTEGLIITT